MSFRKDHLCCSHYYACKIVLALVVSCEGIVPVTNTYILIQEKKMLIIIYVIIQSLKIYQRY